MTFDVDRIARRKFASFLALDVYFDLLAGVEDHAVGTREFQKKFNRFCMVRRAPRWQKVFYGLFEELLPRRADVTLRDILVPLDAQLRKKLGQTRLEVSFSSKMLTFLRPGDFPIWDSWVVKNLQPLGLDLRLMCKGGIGEREEEALARFDQLTDWFRRQLKRRETRAALRRFDCYLPDGYGERIPAMKKLDYILWADRGEEE